MEMHQIRYFLSVARHLNFTKAARELRISQPSLTRAIQRLEAELGDKLFRRERSNTHLSHLGRAMLPHLEAAFASAEAAKAEAAWSRQGRMGTLAIGVGADVEPSPTITAIVSTLARMSGFELTIVVASDETVEGRLLAGEFDAAILARLGDDDDRFKTCQISADELVVAFAEGHRFEGGAEVTVSALQGEALVVRSRCLQNEALARALVGKGPRCGIRHRVDDARWLAGLVGRGQGCAVVPAELARAHALSHRPLGGVELRHRTTLATVPGRPHPPALAALVQQICSTTSS